MIKSDIRNIGKWSNIEIEVVCDLCSIEKKIKYKLYTSYGYKNGEYLCRKCKLIRNNIEKYGVENVFQLDHVKEKTRKTNKEKRGVEFVSQCNDIKNKIKESISKLNKDEINKKRSKTNIEKYGIDNVSKLNEIKEKKKKTCLKNNGVEYISQKEVFKNKIKEENIKKYKKEHFFQTDEFKEKSKETCLNKYGVEIASTNTDISSKIKKSTILALNGKISNNIKNIYSIDNESKFFEIKCDHCKNIFKIEYSLFYKRREKNTEICTICNPIDKHQSGKEIKLFNFIKSIYGGEIIQNFRINNREIDIFLPELKIGFEFNGLRWHSDIYKEKNFHIDKLLFFEKNGIRIFNIWEDDYDNKSKIIESQIKNHIGVIDNKIFARKCSIKEIQEIQEIKDFLNNNHIQGYVNSKIKIGLYSGNELVSIMTFDNIEGRKRMQENQWNINRFCNKLDTVVVGGGSKLLTFFIRKYNPNRIISYADKDWSIGNLYEKLGFNKLTDTSPDYKYVVMEKRIHKSNFKKSKTGISEKLLELPRIWDCGKIKYELLLTRGNKYFNK